MTICLQPKSVKRFVLVGGFSFNTTPSFSFGGTGASKPGVISFSASSQQVRNPYFRADLHQEIAKKIKEQAIKDQRINGSESFARSLRCGSARMGEQCFSILTIFATICKAHSHPVKKV